MGMEIQMRRSLVPILRKKIHWSYQFMCKNFEMDALLMQEFARNKHTLLTITEDSSYKNMPLPFFIFLLSESVPTQRCPVLSISASAGT